MAESERLKRRIAELEQVVRELRQKNPSRSNAPPPAAPAAPTPAVVLDDPDRGQDNKKRRVIVDRFARFKLDEAALAEVAAAASRERSHEPEGHTTSTAGVPSNTASGPSGGSGAPRPPTGDGKEDYRSEPYRMFMNPGEEMVHDSVGRKTFLGAPAGQSMLRRIKELTSAQAVQTLGTGEDDLLSVPEDNAFGIVFPDMRKTFPFTTIWSHENFSGEIIGLLPNKEQAEILLQSWKEEVVTIILGYHV